MSSARFAAICARVSEEVGLPLLCEGRYRANAARLGLGPDGGSGCPSCQSRSGCDRMVEGCSWGCCLARRVVCSAFGGCGTITEYSSGSVVSAGGPRGLLPDTLTSARCMRVESIPNAILRDSLCTAADISSGMLQGLAPCPALSRAQQSRAATRNFNLWGCCNDRDARERISYNDVLQGR